MSLQIANLSRKGFNTILSGWTKSLVSDNNATIARAHAQLGPAFSAKLKAGLRTQPLNVAFTQALRASLMPDSKKPHGKRKHDRRRRFVTAA